MNRFEREQDDSEERDCNGDSVAKVKKKNGFKRKWSTL